VLKSYHPEVLRMFMLGTHYRSALDFSDSALDEAKTALDRLYETKKRCETSANGTPVEQSADSLTLTPDFITAMNDDFNTPEALAALFDLSRLLNKAMDQGDDIALLAAQFHAMTALLGIASHDVHEWFQGGDADSDAIETLIVERSEAKKARDFARADAIRNELAAQGIVLEDTAGGTTWKKA